MTELLWQTFFLLAIAFFFGAVVACGLKRRFYYGTARKAGDIVPVSVMPATPDASQPKIEVAPRAVPEGQRFERALSGTAKEPAAAPLAAPVASAPAAQPSAAVPAPKPSVPQPAPTPVPMSAPAAPVMAAAVTVAAVAASVSEVQPGIPRVSVSTGSGAPVKAEEGGARPSDDLTRIRGIDPVAQGRLKELGIRRFEDLASLTTNDVKGLSDTLGVKDRIQDENWVGQAQILGRGGETYFSRRSDQGIAIPEWAEPAAAAPVPAPVAPPPAAPTPEAKTVFPRVSVGTGSGAPVKMDEGGSGPSDDLTRIRGIDPVLQGKLKELGIRRFEELASLSANDVKGLDDALGFKDAVGPENWVGQAQTLAKGGETYYSRRLDRGVPVPEAMEPTAVAPAPAAPAASAEPAPSAPRPADSATPQAASSPASDVGYLRSVRSEALVGEEGGRAPIVHGDVDDLKRIRGIGVLIEKKLNSLGILSYEQVANWTGADIERISNILDFKGRIERENWIEQARILATGGQTEFSRRGER